MPKTLYHIIKQQCFELQTPGRFIHTDIDHRVIELKKTSRLILCKSFHLPGFRPWYSLHKTENHVGSHTTATEHAGGKFYMFPQVVSDFSKAAKNHAESVEGYT